MPAVDQAYLERMIAAIETVPEDQKPEWGKMTPAQMRGHLAMVFRYTCGKGPDMPFKGNWKSRILFKPLILNGIVAIPHNIRIPKPKGVKEMPPPPEAEAEELKAEVEAFLAGLSAGELNTRVHPFFGPLTPREWAKFHHAHCTHHLKQFGLSA